MTGSIDVLVHFLIVLLVLVAIFGLVLWAFRTIPWPVTMQPFLWVVYVVVYMILVLIAINALLPFLHAG